jgi:hypothetical protein
MERVMSVACDRVHRAGPQEIPSEPLFDRSEMAGEGAELSPETRNPSRSMLAIARDSVAEADFFPECLRSREAHHIGALHQQVRLSFDGVLLRIGQRIADVAKAEMESAAGMDADGTIALRLISSTR